MNHSPPNLTVRAPGRINLIGDHTDYTGGFVLPMTLDLHTTIKGTFTNERVWRLESESHGTAIIDLDIERPHQVEPQWARYPAGVLVELRSLGTPLRGFTGTVSTELPIGAGLSSSAALEVATARVALNGLPGDSRPTLDDVALARACQRAEFTATGIPCGIMDQLSIITGEFGYATLIDCTSLDVTRVRIPDSVRIEHRFITSRTLVGSEYADRVAQCREIESTIGPLRQASIIDLDRLDSDVLRQRARHVLSENLRVQEFVDALSRSDFVEAGRLMVASHRSSIDDFQTSTPAMDDAVESALREPGVLGARMTGGGFGGCIVILHTT